MNSREKVFNLRRRLRELKPPDEGAAQMLQVLMALSPMLAKAIPSDPAELDRYLRMVALGAIHCRSDDAPVLRLHEWLGEEWEPAEMGEGG